MKYHLSRLLSLLFILCCLSPVLSGQSIPEDSAAAPILPIPLSNISQSSNESITLANRAGADRLTEKEARDYTSEIDSMLATVDAFVNDSIYLAFTGFTSRDLDNTDNRINMYLVQISLEQARLKRRYDDLLAGFNGLDAANKRWQVTLDQSAVNNIPDALVERIHQTKNSVDSVNNLLQGDMKQLLLQQDRLLGRKNKLETMKSSVQGARLSMSEHIVAQGHAGIF